MDFGINSWELNGDAPDIWWRYYCIHCKRQIPIGFHLQEKCPHCNKGKWEVMLYAEDNKYSILNALFPYEKIDVDDSIEFLSYE